MADSFITVLDGNGDPVQLHTEVVGSTNTPVHHPIGRIAHDAPATDPGIRIAGYASAAAPTDVSNDADLVNAWYLRNGSAVVHLAQSGTSIATGFGSGSNALRVSMANDSMKLEDAVAASGDPGFMALTVRSDTASATSANGDYHPLLVDASGRLHVVLSTAANQPVNLATIVGTAADVNNGAVSAGTLRVTLANNSTGVIATVSTVTTVTTVTTVSTVTALTAISTSVTPGTSAAHLGKAEDAVAGSGDTGVMALAVRADVLASTAANGDYVPLLENGIGALYVQDTPGTANGLTPFFLISANTTNSTLVSAGAHNLHTIYCTNTNAAVRFLKLYNKATAPTVGTDTPIHTFLIPGNTAGAGFSLNIDKGISFSLGIGLGFTTGSANADTGAVATGEIICNLDYK